MSFSDPALRLRPDEAVERLVPILGEIDGEVVFCTCIDDDGFVGDSECFASREQPKSTLPVEELFYLARTTGAPAMMFTSGSSGPIDQLQECDVLFTRRLLDAGRACGVRVHDHFLVGGGTYRKMSESMDVWGH